MGGKLSKYQKFEVEVISRGEIHGADYNPRVISEDARKRLKRMLAKHGLVQPLVWNRRTGNLVSGHQRLSQLDQLERSQDYDLQVSVVDVDEREEKILNVQLNNPSMQGDWDMDSGEFYFTVVCENEGQKKAMLKALGVPHWEAFVHGSQLAGLLGV